MAVKDFLKKKYSEAKQSYKESSARNKELRELEKKELFEARKKEKVKYAQEKAQYEREKKLQFLKGGGYSGAFKRELNVVGKNVKSSGGLGIFSSGYSKPQSQVTVKTYKRIKIKGKKGKYRKVLISSEVPKQSLPRSSVDNIVKMI